MYYPSTILSPSRSIPGNVVEEPKARYTLHLGQNITLYPIFSPPHPTFLFPRGGLWHAITDVNIVFTKVIP